MQKTDLIKLSVKAKDAGYAIWLDDKELHHVKDYKIEQGDIPGTAMMTIVLKVEYP